MLAGVVPPVTFTATCSVIGWDTFTSATAAYDPESGFVQDNKVRVGIHICLRKVQKACIGQGQHLLAHISFLLLTMMACRMRTKQHQKLKRQAHC